MVTLKLEPFDPEVGIAIDAAWISFMSTWDIKYNFENFYKLQIIQSFCFAIQLSGKNSVRNETDPVPLEDRDHAEDACGHLLAALVATTSISTVILMAIISIVAVFFWFLILSQWVWGLRRLYLAS